MESWIFSEQPSVILGVSGEPWPGTEPSARP
jgi:hypothetical protein